MVDLIEIINDLDIKLDHVENLNVRELESQLFEIGFKCRKCGECCRSISGDNNVVVFPDEVLAISAASGLSWDGVCEPSRPQYVGKENTLHAFEWELKRQNNGDCIFINKNNICTVYPHRPFICATYPFYLVFRPGYLDPYLEVSDCSGKGGLMDRRDALELATLLKTRLIFEIKEEIQVLKNLQNHDGLKPINNNPCCEIKGKTSLAVHDSRGITYLNVEYDQ